MEHVDHLIQCPYDANHVIYSSRFITHLCKCRKQFKGSYRFSTCPYNATHNVPTPELQFHSSICPDKKKLDSFLYVAGEKNKEQIASPSHVPKFESWDDQSNVASYLDVKDELIMNRPLLRLPVGKSKAQRKEFFRKETERFELLTKGETSQKLTPEKNENLKSDETLFTNPQQEAKSTYLPKCKESKESNDEIDDKSDDDDDSYFSIVRKNVGRGGVIPSSSKEK